MAKESEVDTKNTTEEDILNIAGINDGEESGDDNTEGQDDTNEDGSSRTAEDRGGVGTSGDGQRPGQPGKEKKGQAPAGAAKPLKDPKTGQVVAQPGAERRLFETMRSKVNNYEKVEKPALEAKIKAYEEAANYKAYGFTPEQALQSYKLMKAFNEKPAETIKWLLTQAQAGGIKVDLGAGAAGVDPAAIKQMIAEAMAPITKASEARENEQKLRTEAETEYNAFISAHPDAGPHEEAIAGLLQHDPSLSLDGAYWRLRAFFEKNRLDFSKPLAHHAETMKRGQKGQVKRPPFMPSGRNQHGADQGGDVTERDAGELAPVNAEYSDIIRAAIKQARGGR